MTCAYGTAVGVDPDLIGPALDLTAPELEGIAKRYFGEQHQQQEGGWPRALVVGGTGDQRTDVAGALREDGWAISSCSGPGQGPCPIMQGRRCDLRHDSDVAVVFVDAARSGGYGSVLPLLRCAADPGSPSVTLLQGRADPPRVEGERAIAGAVRARATIAAIARRLFSGSNVSG